VAEISDLDGPRFDAQAFRPRADPGTQPGLATPLVPGDQMRRAVSNEFARHDQPAALEPHRAIALGEFEPVAAAALQFTCPNERPRPLPQHERERLWRTATTL
jgi:hypothetical protein